MGGLLVFFVYGLLLVGLFYKRQKQVGNKWGKPFEASVEIEDIPLACTHCNHDKFTKREGQFNTSIVSFLLSSFWNRSAHCYICRKCGCAHWFNKPRATAKIERIDSKS